MSKLAKDFMRKMADLSGPDANLSGPIQFSDAISI
jgi:hypothetical protein